VAPLKLNIGCGHFPLADYINVDIQPLEEVDLVADAHHLPFTNESLSEIYAGHLLEHLTYAPLFLIECYRVLIQAGELVLVLPDLSWAAEYPWHIIFGAVSFEELGRISRFQLHRSWWNEESLYQFVKPFGFDYLGRLAPDDPRLTSQIDWQFGSRFRKGKFFWEVT